MKTLEDFKQAIEKSVWYDKYYESVNGLDRASKEVYILHLQEMLEVYELLNKYFATKLSYNSIQEIQTILNSLK